jgi:hypothetical protein
MMEINIFVNGCQGALQGEEKTAISGRHGCLRLIPGFAGSKYPVVLEEYLRQS